MEVVGRWGRRRLAAKTRDEGSEQGGNTIFEKKLRLDFLHDVEL
jgi:hypothetical protein